MATADVICMAGIPAAAAKVIGEFIDSQQADDAELAELAANLTATSAQLNAAGALSATTSTVAELNLVDNAIASVTFAVAAGAANVCIITGTIKDAAGATIAAVRALDIYISEATTGIGVTADTYSTGASITTGTSIVADTANKVWKLLTHTDGTFAISITDTAKPADQYLVAVNPISRALHVSAASAALWGA